jgi:hypothetical protein
VYLQYLGGRHSTEAFELLVNSISCLSFSNANPRMSQFVTLAASKKPFTMFENRQTDKQLLKFQGVDGAVLLKKENSYKY